MTAPQQQLEMELDLGATAANIRLAPSLSARPTRDGRGVEIRAETPEAWVSTVKASAILGMDSDRLCALGREGVIDGRQPNKPLADVVAGRPTNHKWEWNLISVLDYKQRLARAAERARGR